MSIPRRQFCVVGVKSVLLACVGCRGPRRAVDTGGVDDPYVPPPRLDLRASDPGPLDLGPIACSPDAVNGGPLATLQVGAARRLTDDSTYDVWLCRDARGVYALNNECTHASCPLLLVSGNTFYCRCHGAQFDFNGEHPTAPAIQPLDHYGVCDDGAGNALVDLTVLVPASGRFT